jgi:hypothetical protein
MTHVTYNSYITLILPSVTGHPTTLLKGQPTYFLLENPQGNIFIEVEDFVETGG